MNNKAIACSMGLCVIVLMIGSGCQRSNNTGNTQTPNQETPVSKPLSQIEGWTTYTNATLGYQFNYPSSWVVFKDSEIDTTRIGTDGKGVLHSVFINNVTNPFVNPSDPNQISYSVRTWSKDPQTSIDEWLKENITTLSISLVTSEDVVNTKAAIQINSSVSSHDAIDIQICDPAWEHQIFIDGGQWVHGIDLRSRRYQSLWPDLIQSFKIDDTQSVSTNFAESVVFNQYYCGWLEDDPRLNELFQ